MCIYLVIVCVHMCECVCMLKRIIHPALYMLGKHSITKVHPQPTGAFWERFSVWVLAQYAAVPESEYLHNILWDTVDWLQMQGL